MDVWDREKIVDHFYSQVRNRIFPDWEKRNSRGFDGRGMHSNGTRFDDSGYDWMYRDEHGDVRPDKVPPYRGTYLLGVLTAVRVAFDLSELVVPDEEKLPTDTKAMLNVETGFLSSSDDEYEYPLEECEGSRGVIDVFDGDFLTTGLPAFFFQYVFWDEETSTQLMDPEDFCHALSQIAEDLLMQVPNWCNPLRPDATFHCVRALMMLSTSALWDDGSDVWALRGIEAGHIDNVNELGGWDSSVGELLASEEGKAARKQNAKMVKAISENSSSEVYVDWLYNLPLMQEDAFQEARHAYEEWSGCEYPKIVDAWIAEQEERMDYKAERQGAGSDKHVGDAVDDPLLHPNQIPQQVDEHIVRATYDPTGFDGYGEDIPF